MGKRLMIGAVVVLLASTAAYSVANRRHWGRDLTPDPANISGRASLCKQPIILGDSIPAVGNDLGRVPRGEGFEHSWEYTFDVAKLAGGDVQICSEYGNVHVVGISGTKGRLRITISDPFPGGGDGIDETKLVTSFRSDGGTLRVAMWQLTQGMTTFRSMLQSGARHAVVNVALELPRTGGYALNLIANHQRLTVKNLDVQGSLEGYLSPGADLDVGLIGPLTVRLNNASLKPDWRRDAGVDYLGGTSTILRPLTSTTVDGIFTSGDATMSFTGADVGLDVTVGAKLGRATIDIGPVEASAIDSAGTHARSTGFVGALKRVVVRASSGGGAVAVRWAAP